MKQNVPVVIIALILGIAVGWLLKPGPGTTEDPQAATGKEDAKLPPANTGERPNRPPAREIDASDAPPMSGVRTMVLGGDGGMDEQAEEIHDRMMEAMAERMEKQDEAKISEMVAKLGLSPAQEAKLREHFEARRLAFARMLGGEPGGGSLDALQGDGLDEFAANELTPEQQERYEANKEATRQRQVESKALKDLAQITDVVELRPGQRDSLYQILHDRADASLGQQSAETAAAAIVADGLGIPFDSDAMGATVMVPDGTGVPDGAAILEQMKEQRQKQVDEQVEAVSSVLDEQQLQTYRTHLETRGPFLDGVIAE